MGSAITSLPLLFHIFDRQRKIYSNALKYFGIRIREEIFFFFDVEDPARNQKLCAEMMRKIEKQGLWIAKKKSLKST